MTWLLIVLLILLDVLGTLVVYMLYMHLKRAEEVLNMARQSFISTDSRGVDAEKMAEKVAKELPGQVVKALEKASESGTKLPTVDPKSEDVF